MNEDWISITEAAGRLTAAGDRIDRSSLSRYLKQHADALPLKPDGKSNLVNFVALVAHRGENVRIRTSASPATTRKSETQFPGTQLDGTSRKASADAIRAHADAEMRSMDLAARRRELTPVAEVDQAGRDAVAKMQNAFERAIEGEAQALSLKYGWDERVVRIALKGFAKAGLTEFNRIVLEKLDAMRRQEDAGGIQDDYRAEAAGLQ